MENELKIKQHKIYALLIMVTIIWGLKPVIIKIGLLYMSSIQYNVFRMMFATVGGWITILVMKDFKPIEKRDYKLLTLISVFGFFIFQWFYGLGIGKTTSGNASIIMGTVPLIVLVMNHIFKIKRISRIKMIGVAISLIGLCLTVASGGEVGQFKDNLIGMGYIFISAIGYSIYMVFSKTLTIKYSPRQITTLAITITTVLIIIFSKFDIFIGGLNVVSMATLVYTGVIAMFIGNFIWTWAIKRISSNNVAIFNNLTPIFSIVLGFVILNEQISIYQIIGAMIIFAGLWVSNYLNISRKIKNKKNMKCE